jgi:alanine racemase
VHLAGLGHRDVAVVLIAQHPDTPVDMERGISARRLAGIRTGFAAAGAGDIALRILSAPVSEDGGRAAFEALSGGSLPTAVITLSDVTAIGLINAAIDAGLSLPDDLSIIGFDDIPAAAWVSPRLTTVHQPIREKGRLAAKRLIDAIGSEEGRTHSHEVLPTRLAVRGSTARPRMTDPLPVAEIA